MEEYEIMCGRYWIDKLSEEELKKTFPAEDLFDDGQNIETSRDIRPSDTAAVIAGSGRNLELENVRWGFPVRNGKLLINARSESVFDRKMFRRGIRNSRAVVPAAGFYEWSPQKEICRFRQPETPLMYLAALIDFFEGERRFVIITTEANESVRKIHDRMPLIIGRNQLEDWILDDSMTQRILTQDQPALSRPGRDGYEQLSMF